MNKRFLLLVMMSLLVFCLSLNVVAQKKKSQKTAVPTIKAQPAVEIEDVIFDKQTAIHWCPIVTDDDSSCSKNKQIINITTILKNADNKDLTYYYNVSGGRIIGSGARVLWDFAEAKAGKCIVTLP